MSENETREWASGAYRDTSDEKLDYEAFYSPLVLREFARYMHRHRKQADGKLRDGDNWQQLFGTPGEHRAVCMGSLVRHVLDLWLFHRGYAGRETIKEALCAILFNAQAYLFSMLIQEEEGLYRPSDHNSLAGLENDDAPQYPLPNSDRDGLPCAWCGGDTATGHQRLCPTLYVGEEVEE